MKPVVVAAVVLTSPVLVFGAYMTALAVDELIGRMTGRGVK